VAERLLKSVLPEELYLQLSATGEFVIEVGEGKKKHEYAFKRKGKTLVRMDGKLYSCCIDVEDQKRPEQDRIVAEYLLVLNDEKRYLATANLTQIYGPWENTRPGRYLTGQEIGRQWTDVLNHQLDALRYQRTAPYLEYNPSVGPIPIVPEPRIGDTIRVQRPAQYLSTRPVDNRITIGQIANQALWMLCHIPPLDHPYPMLRYEDWQGRMMDGTTYGISFQFETRDLELTIDDFSSRLLQPAVQQLAHSLRERHIEGFMELPLPQGVDMAARVTMHGDGRSLRLVRAYDITRDMFLGRIDICPIIRR